MDLNSAINDFDWVLKILDSSKNISHMDTSMKCFTLWESKYNNPSLNQHDSKVITELKKSFWNMFNRKIKNIGTTNI